jgi:23S rRNA pseudouridine2605 synthase
MEDWIAAGRVTVNDEPAHTGQRVTRDDVIAVDGVIARQAPLEASRVLVLNKAAGTICTRHDPEGRATIFDDLPSLRSGRWISVGRLDVQTSGLLLVTNDGALAHRMMHPSTGLDREYAVRVGAKLTAHEIGQLKRGVMIDGEQLKFSDIRYYNGSGNNHWYHVVLLEGRNREVRRLFEAIGVLVSRLKRVRYGPVALPSTLLNGQRQEMSESDLKAVYQLLNLPYTPPPKSAARSRRPPTDRDKRSLLLPYPGLPKPLG